MSEEEKQAIEILKNDEMYITDSFYREFRTTIADKYTKAFEKVLNLIEKQQAEIRQYDKALHDQIIKDYDIEIGLKEEIEKKDKIIDEMAKYISETDMEEDICFSIDCDENTDVDTGEIDCKTCIKEYFKKKAEGK